MASLENLQPLTNTTTHGSSTGGSTPSASTMNNKEQSRSSTDRSAHQAVPVPGEEQKEQPHIRISHHHEEQGTITSVRHT
jgi:hypothetical protein